MQLSKRLGAVAGMVSAGNRVADVGCDHAFLPVYLIQEHHIPSALAMDVRQGPLSRAQEHILAAGLEDKIKTRLSDGLKALKPFEADTLVIAGMGGILIRKILSDSPDVRDSFKELILQPQSDIAELRHYMIDAGFDLMDEDMVLEDGKYYFIMKWIPGMRREEGLQWMPWELEIGPLLLKKRHPALSGYLEREKRIRLEILSALGTTESERSLKRKQEIERELDMIGQALKAICSH